MPLLAANASVPTLIYWLLTAPPPFHAAHHCAG